MKKAKDEKVNVQIPSAIAAEIKSICKETGFDSVSDYVTYVLEQVLLNSKPKKEVYSKEEKKKVSDRLRGLGYLD